MHVVQIETGSKSIRRTTVKVILRHFIGIVTNQRKTSLQISLNSPVNFRQCSTLILRINRSFWFCRVRNTQLLLSRFMIIHFAEDCRQRESAVGTAEQRLTTTGIQRSGIPLLLNSLQGIVRLCNSLIAGLPQSVRTVLTFFGRVLQQIKFLV